MSFVDPNHYELRRATRFMRCMELGTIIWPGQKYWRVTSKFILVNGEVRHVGDLSRQGRTIAALTSPYSY
jgi:hypothetical protein